MTRLGGFSLLYVFDLQETILKCVDYYLSKLLKIKNALKVISDKVLKNILEDRGVNLL